MSEVRLSHIRLDPQAQPRSHLDMEIVQGYAEDLLRGDRFPPLVVFDDGNTHWLADGFHRHYAAQAAGLETLPCEVHEGGLRDAILYSCGANAAHGYRRSNADKRLAVTRMLEDEVWRDWSDREIARQCRVSNRFVSTLRQELAPSDVSVNGSQIERKTQRGGSTYTMNTAGINAGRERDDDEAAPLPSKQEAEAEAKRTGNAVLGSDNKYHVDVPKERQERVDLWFRFKGALWPFADLTDDPAALIASIPDYQHAEFSQRLECAEALLAALRAEWEKAYASNVAAE